MGGMSTMELPNDVMLRVAAEAERRGLTVTELIARTFPEAHTTPRRLSFIGMGRSTSGRHADEADEMLAEGFGR